MFEFSLFGIDYESAVTLAILVAALGLLASQKLRPDFVALLVMTSLIVSGVLTPEAAFSAFGRPIIVIVAGIFVIGAALRDTGVAKILSNVLLRWGGASRSRLLLMTMVTAGLLSSVLSGLLVATILLPALLRAGRRQQIPPSQLLMPMAVAAILGNQLTLIGTTANIIVSDLLAQNADSGLGIFSLTPYAALSLLLAVAWFFLVGKKTLANEMPDEPERPSVRDVERSYGLEGAFYRLRVRSQSGLIGEQLKSSHLREQFDFNVVAVRGDDGKLHAASPDWVLERDCEFVVEAPRGHEAQVHQAAGRHHLEPLGQIDLVDFTLTTQPSLHLTEVVVPYRSHLVGERLSEAGLRSKHGLQVLALNRQGKAIQENLSDLTLETGDILLLEGDSDRVRDLGQRQELVVMTDFSPRPGDLITGKARIAVAILAVALILILTKVVSLAVGLLLASIALIVTGCLSLTRAYQGINPAIVVIVGGMLPLATALQQSGGAGLIAGAITSIGGVIGPLGALVVLYLLIGILTQVVPNSVTAAIFTPVAISMAQDQGMAAQQFAILVVFAANASFISPLTSATNLLIKSKGNYRLRDYLINTIPIFLLQGIAVFALSMLLGGLGAPGAASDAAAVATPEP